MVFVVSAIAASLVTRPPEETGPSTLAPTRRLPTVAITGRPTWPALQHGLTVVDRIMERTFCAALPDRPVLALLHMPVIHLGFREADGGAVLSLVEVVR